MTRRLADGTLVIIPVFCFAGKNPAAPSLYLQSSVHAAEIQGYLVALHLIEYLSRNPPAGNVTIVPLANPYALNCKLGEYTAGRFDLVTGDNWNRNYLDLSFLVDRFLAKHKNSSLASLIQPFKLEMRNYLEQQIARSHGMSYHQKLALQLQSLACCADIVLDLHCDTISVPHVYSATYAMRSALNLNIPFIIEIPHKFGGALDEAIFCPWVSIAEALCEEVPVEAFTIELGSQERLNLKLAIKQAVLILEYLKSKCTKSAALYNTAYSCKLEDFTTIYAKTGGLVIETAQLAEVAPAGSDLINISAPHMLGSYVSDSIVAEKLEQNSIPLTKTATAIVHEGMALMKAMTNFREIS